MQLTGLTLLDVKTYVVDSVSGPDRIELYLVWASVMFAAVFTWWQTRREGGIRAFFRHCLPPGTLTHKSAKADFLFWLSRRLFVPLLVIPLGLSAVTAGYASYGC